MERVDCVVVGAGVVGLAVARALALAGREVLLLEAAEAIGTGTSSRNSEVIHSGLYYETGSLKARLCVQGQAMMYAYCAGHGIGHQRCGKLIVATHVAQLPKLQQIAQQAAANGVTELQVLTREQALALEPQLHCVGALLSPGTGIVDSHGLMLALLGDLENAGGVLALHCTVEQGVCEPDGIVLRARDGTELKAVLVVNAAGLGAQTLARRFTGLEARHVPESHHAKGNYFSLSGKSPFRRLIYPVPEAAGLGTHLTLDLGGQARFGPDVQWVDSPDDLRVDATRAAAFYAGVRAYWPELPDGALLPAYAGIRPKLQGPTGPGCDFLIQGPAQHGVAGLVNLFGIESPGLTSALALGDHVAALLAGRGRG
jgi:L-2-hydroxyglutarate oxidase LhgO